MDTLVEIAMCLGAAAGWLCVTGLVFYLVLWVCQFIGHAMDMPEDL